MFDGEMLRMEQLSKKSRREERKKKLRDHPEQVALAV